MAVCVTDEGHFEIYNCYIIVAIVSNICKDFIFGTMMAETDASVYVKFEVRPFLRAPKGFLPMPSNSPLGLFCSAFIDSR